MPPLTTRPEGRGGEEEALARLAALLPPPPIGEVWAGDDTAVVTTPGGHSSMLLAADALVGGLDADFSLTTLADLGWKALAVNVSDIAAMGGRPAHAVVSVVGLGPDELEDLYGGLVAAAREFGCSLVGGDLSGGAEVVVSVAITGWVEGVPVLRSGARPGDDVWVSAPLGAAAAGLRLLRERGPGQGPAGPAEPWRQRLIKAHARPRPALNAGAAARQAGATAMIDVSDGFSIDVARLARSSGVGVDLGPVPVAEGATTEEALRGGDDYVLVFTTPPEIDVCAAFVTAGEAAPIHVGRCVEGAGHLRLAGRSLEASGWEHDL